MAPATNVYVDGFNLYYGLRGTPYKWLDLVALFDRVLPRNDVRRVRYFTARIKPHAGDPDGPASVTRQEVYLAALAASPRVSIHYGQFLASKSHARLVSPPPPPASPTVRVHKMEEKGSDVNLAAWMLVDAFESDCEVSVLVSNDSDLAFPMQVLSQRLARTVGLINPRGGGHSQALLKERPAFKRSLHHADLAACQFPNVVVAGGRRLHRPATW